MSGDANGSGPTAAVCVITYRRPEFVRTCLTHLAGQTRAPEQILVVDASPDRLTRDVVAGFPGVRYLHSDAGPGTMATSRAMALAASTQDVLVFLDDDANADADWLEWLLVPYADAGVAAVGGRARNGQPGEESEGTGQIGKLLRNGRLTGNFAADPGHDVDVDHLLGANMSIRRSVLLDLGGIRDYYPGTCLREESDIFLRVRAAGHRIVYTPRAVVTHVAAPYARGRRFDLRYHYFGHRNHVVLLVRTLGARDPRTRRYVGATLRDDVVGAIWAGIGALGDRGSSARARVRRGGGSVLRGGTALAGLVTGSVAAARLQRRDGRPGLSRG